MKVLKLINRLTKKDSNRILLYDGRMYPDIIYAILMELYERIPNTKIHVILTHKENDYQKQFPGVRFYKKRSLAGMYQLFRSKYIVCDGYFGDSYLTEQQVIINVWHGLGLKKILGYTDAFSNRSKPFATYAISYSEYFSSVVQKAFLVDRNHIISCGSPRNDLFYLGKRSDLDIIKQGVSRHAKVVIWMPTYRQSATAASSNDGKIYKYGIPLIDENNIRSLDDKLKENDVFLIIKYHVLQNDNDELIGNFTNIKVITSNDAAEYGIPFYQIIGQCDALISDYSSIYIEFMSLNRPICYAYDDLDEYESKRGFMFESPKNIMPGYHATTIEDLFKFVVDVATDNDQFADDRERTIRRLELYTDGNNAKRLVDQIQLLKTDEENGK